jgi:hypothetical protein
MKYRDLVQFEPIETIVQLREASKQDYAFNLLDTYVISDRMADVLINVVFEQLQYDRQADQKGLLVVGNYGTGKSHLMSVISTIAETDGSARRLHNSNVAEKAQTIEGKFHVIREEIGATTMPLRDIVCGSIQENLAKMGVDYSFPSIDQVRSNKDAFAEMMGAFHAKYPDKGLLVVIDELLDYLRHRNEQDIILDLGFLRELGEICRTTRFRFIAGVQEMLFENPRFQFVADQLRRVKERFEQVQIVREDVAYVVSERLLKKDDRQKALIREHLQKFSPLYERLGSRLEEYVTLFPVHPAYLSTFERVSVAEKREILKTISGEIKKLYDCDVPANEPGMISFDSYWPYIEGDSSLRSDPNIREVLTKSQVLQEKIETGFTRPNLKDMAIRIVRAMSVHRLTTGDINVSLGLTSEELRDQLFLYAEIPENDSEFLRTTIEAALKEILKTVSYQYISVNESNGQYYLDLAKDVPVDDFIEDKAQALSKAQLDRYYFTALSDVMEKSLNNTHVGNYRIWKHELNWISRKATRLGYLFFGAPNERSTAQPPRDFYVYMLQPYEPPKFKDEQKPDEIFFRLKHGDEVFNRLLSLYAAARELEVTAPSGTQELYRRKADEYLRQVNKWLRENLLSAFEVTYKGQNDKLTKTTSQIPPNASSSEIVDAIASTYLSKWFDEKYPDYPSFSRLRSHLTEANLKDYVQQTIRAIGGTMNQSALAILNGLVLYESEEPAFLKSGYAKWILQKLEAKGHGQVVNRSELIEKVFTSQGTEDIEQTIEFKLEPELFAVILAALVYNGSIVLTINGVQYDAMKYEQLARLPLNDIVAFSHIKKPSGLPMDSLNALVSLLELPPTTLHPNMLEYGLNSIQTKVQDLVQETITATETVRSGIQCWEGPLLTAEEQRTYREHLDGFKQFLEAVMVYNTVAKLHNFRFSAEEVSQQKSNIALLAKTAKMQNQVNELSPSVHYLQTAKGYLPLNDEWNESLDITLGNLLDAVKTGGSYNQELQTLKKLKARFIDTYLGLHEKARLNAHEDSKKASLLNDPRVGALKQLGEISLLPREHLEEKLISLSNLRACWSLTRETLEQTPYCANCRFEPKSGTSMPSRTLDEFEDDIEDLLEQWTTTLLSTFNDPELKQNIELLNNEQQLLVRSLLESEEFSLPIDVKLIQAIKELLEGIERVEISTDEVLQMMGNGNPLTVEELQDRLNTLIKRRVGNKPINRVRIMLKNS